MFLSPGHVFTNFLPDPLVLICPLPDCLSLRIDCISQHLWLQHPKFLRKTLRDRHLPRWNAPPVPSDILPRRKTASRTTPPLLSGCQAADFHCRGAWISLVKPKKNPSLKLTIKILDIVVKWKFTKIINELSKLIQLIASSLGSLSIWLSRRCRCDLRTPEVRSFHRRIWDHIAITTHESELHTPM